jgi:tripartite-type tricarboxylate transporter receptor subunit TctC
MAGLVAFRKAGVETIDIPGKGSPENLAALLGGHVDAACIAYGAIKDQVKAGRVRCLLFWSDRRYSDPSDVPCAAELGFTDAAKLIALIGLYAHKDTSEEIKKTLIDAFKKVCEAPEFKKKIQELGEEPRFGGPEFVKESIKKLEEVGVPILKELGLYVEK